LSEDFDAKDVGDYLFCFALYVGVDEGDIVIGGDDIAEGGETLFNPLLWYLR